ncbi:hypothetical protein [Pseudarthrobacter chlorophenolicus]|nr:hypothetical protein [Pseudarthrobacter chlorophenolicus]
MSHTPDPRAMGLSTTDYCKSLPRLRYSHEARGLVLLMPRTGLVVVPFLEHKGGWDAVVVDGGNNYPVGGYHVYLGDTEIETATEIRLGEPVPVQLVTLDEADALEDGSSILTRDHGSLRKKTIDGEVFWTRTILKRVSIRTEEIADQFPAKYTVPARKEAAHV